MSSEFEDWGSEQQSPQEVESPQQSSTGRSGAIREIDAVSDRRGRRWSLGIIGLHNSGKTSWLFSLLQGAETQSRSGLGWRVIRRAKNAAKIVDKPFAGESQEGTPEGMFSRGSLIKVRRRSLGRLPAIPGIGSGHWLEVSEVAGETVKRLADGGLSVLGEARGDVKKAMEALDDYLNRADMLICLVELDEAGNLAAPLDELKKVLTQGPRAGLPAIKRPVTILLTKADKLRSRPGQDLVRLPRSKSSLVALLETTSLPEIAAAVSGFATDDATVEFSVSRLIMMSEARDSLEVQERIAVDFLQSISYSAARELVNLKGVFGPELRCFLCAPYGDDFREGRKAIKPTKDKIRALNVWEPLEAQFEDRWRWESRQAWKRRSIVAATTLGLSWWFGTGHLDSLESEFESAVEMTDNASAARSQEIVTALAGHPLARAERAYLPSLDAEQGVRWLQLREQSIARVEQNLEDSFNANPNFVNFEQSALAHGLSPLTKIKDGAGGETTLESASSPRNRETIWGFVIRGEPAELLPMAIVAADSMELAARFQRWSPYSVDAGDYPAIQQRAVALREMIRTPETDPAVRALPLEPLDQALGHLVARIGAATDFTVEAALLSGRNMDVCSQDDKMMSQHLDAWTALRDQNFEEKGRPGLRALEQLRSGVDPLFEPAKEAWLDDQCDQWWKKAPWSPGESRFSKGVEESVGDLPALIAAALDECKQVEEEIFELNSTPIGQPTLQERVDFVEQTRHLREVQQLSDRLREGEVTQASLRELEALFHREGSLPLLAALDPIRQAQWRLVVGSLREFHSQRALVGELQLTEMEILDRVDDTLAILDDSERVPETDRRLIALRRCLAGTRFDEQLYGEELDGILPFVGGDLELSKAVAEAILDSDHRLQASNLLLDRDCQLTAGLAATLWPQLCSDESVLLDDLASVELAAKLIRVSTRDCWDTPAKPLAVRLVKGAVEKALGGNANQPLEPHADRIAALISVLRELPDGGSIDELELVEPILEAEQAFLLARLGADVGIEDVPLEECLGTLLRRALAEDSYGLNRLQDLSAALDREWALAASWDLLPATVTVGGRPEVIWVSRDEWTVSDVQQVLDEAEEDVRERIKQAISRDVAMPNLPTTFLGVLDRSVAADLVAVAGMRLPTREEFASYSAKVEWKANPKFDATSPTDLVAVGDVSPDGIVGLVFGVREWTEDSEEPIGGSSLWAGVERPSFGDRAGWTDVGIRPVLDFFAIPPANDKEDS